MSNIPICKLDCTYVRCEHSRFVTSKGTDKKIEILCGMDLNDCEYQKWHTITAVDDINIKEKKEI
jgi:hypothetical protein